MKISKRPGQEFAVFLEGQQLSSDTFQLSWKPNNTGRILQERDQIENSSSKECVLK